MQCDSKDHPKSSESIYHVNVLNLHININRNNYNLSLFVQFLLLRIICVTEFAIGDFHLGKV